MMKQLFLLAVFVGAASAGFPPHPQFDKELLAAGLKPENLKKINEYFDQQAINIPLAQELAKKLGKPRILKAEEALQYKLSMELFSKLPADQEAIFDKFQEKYLK